MNIFFSSFSVQLLPCFFLPQSSWTHPGRFSIFLTLIPGEALPFTKLCSRGQIQQHVFHTIGIHKSKFRVLDRKINMQPDRARRVVIVCAMLHNLARRLRLSVKEHLQYKKTLRKKTKAVGSQKNDTDKKKVYHTIKRVRGKEVMVNARGKKSIKSYPIKRL